MANLKKYLKIEGRWQFMSVRSLAISHWSTDGNH